LVLFGLTGLTHKALKFFTPVVTGTVLILLTLQLSGSLIRGALGITAGHPAIDPAAVIVSLISIATVVLINLKCRGFLKSIAVLIGTITGWLAALALGLTPGIQWVHTNPIQLPPIFAWGRPTFDPGVILVSIISGVLILTNLVAALLAMERTLNTSIPRSTFNRGVIFTGISDILVGLGATVGVVPFSASAGLVGITGVAARLPFIISAFVMLGIGLLPPVSLFLSSIPVPVGYSVLMAAFCQMVGFGFKDYARLSLTGRQFFIIGLSLMTGAGIMNLPPSAFITVPTILRYMLGNGFIMGMIICILLEHVFLPERLLGE
jgi:xanthine/uracil permease